MAYIKWMTSVDIDFCEYRQQQNKYVEKVSKY